MTCAENGLETIHDKCVEIRLMAIINKNTA